MKHSIMFVDGTSVMAWKDSFVGPTWHDQWRCSGPRHADGDESLMTVVSLGKYCRNHSPQAVWPFCQRAWKKKSEALQSPNLFRNSYSFSEVSHIIHVGLEMTACCSNINLSQFSFGFPAMSDCKKKTKNQTTPNQAVSLNWKHLQAWWSALAHGFLPFRRPGTLFATHWRRRTRLRMRLLTLKTMTLQTR